LRDAVAALAFERELALERELESLARSLRDALTTAQAQLVERQGRLQAEFERLDGYTVPARLDAALRGVGLGEEIWSRPVAALSGGERRRAALAAVLLGHHELLLLDEPTNHLDLDACEWLEGYLTQFGGAAVLVSHDRHFLDRLCQRTWHLERGRLTIYSGNYSFFDQQRRLRYQQELAAWENQRAKIRQAEDYIARNIAGQKTKQAQSRRKQLAKLERVEEPVPEAGLIRFRIEARRPSGGTVLQTEGLAKRYGERVLFRDLELHVTKGERIGIIGPNGCGKTTLLKVLAGVVRPDTGQVTRGHNIDLGLYDQELTSVADHRTPLQELHAIDPVATVGEIRSCLGAFGFAADLHERAVRDLSGGQRSRLALVRLIKQGYNTLLLDEPTNHLDVRSRESLEAALQEFTGTLVVVSHDRRFLDKLVQRLVVFLPPERPDEAGHVEVYLGNYADWIRHRAAAPSPAGDRSDAALPSRAPAAVPPAATTGPPSAAQPSPLSKNEQMRRREWIAAVEREIAALEAERDAAVAEIGRPETKPQRRLALGRRCVDLDRALEEKFGLWERWHREIEEGLGGGLG
jgi:ATP-binding cassette subfamily F protein 3